MNSRRLIPARSWGRGSNFAVETSSTPRSPGLGTSTTARPRPAPIVWPLVPSAVAGGHRGRARPGKRWGAALGATSGYRDRRRSAGRRHPAHVGPLDRKPADQGGDRPRRLTGGSGAGTTPWVGRAGVSGSVASALCQHECALCPSRHAKQKSFRWVHLPLRCADSSGVG